MPIARYIFGRDKPSLTALAHGGGFTSSPGRNGQPLDDVDAEAFQPRNLAVAPHHQPDLRAPEVGEDLSAQSEVSKRVARRRLHVREARSRDLSLQHEPLEGSADR